MKKLLLILLLATSVAQAETYKWSDGEGTVRFSDSRVEIPELFRKSAKPLGMGSQAGSNSDAKVSPPGKTADLGKGGYNQTAITSQMEGLKERMQNDEGIMTLIRTFQNDPEMQSLLRDPAVLSAIQTGDVSTLMGNPAFLRVLNNPRVREIEKKLGTPGEATR